MTKESHIHATSRKSALTVHAVTTWLPRVYPTYVCKQMMKINCYSTTHALLLNGRTNMFPP
jgi:hypothetical protein